MLPVTRLSRARLELTVGIRPVSISSFSIAGESLAHRKDNFIWKYGFIKKSGRI